MKKYGFYLVFALLLLPVIWIGILKKGQIVSQKLPVFGERFYDTKIGDTVFHTISDFSFTDQTGAKISQDDFKGKIYVANFFFASCPDVCPAMMTNLQFVYNKFKDAPDVRFLSHTVDPARDSVRVLAQYGANLGAKPGQWYFVTGSKEALYMAAEHDYLLAAVTTDIKTAFIHSDKIVLIDKDRRIRGIYDGLNFNEMRQLNDDIKALLSESLKP